MGKARGTGGSRDSEPPTTGVDGAAAPPDGESRRVPLALSLAVRSAPPDLVLLRVLVTGRLFWLDRTGVGAYRGRQTIRDTGLPLVHRHELRFFRRLDRAGQDQVLDAKEVFGIGTELVEVYRR